MRHKPQTPRVRGSLRACLHRSFDVLKLCEYALGIHNAIPSKLAIELAIRYRNQIMRGSVAGLAIRLDRPKVTLLYDTHIWFLYLTQTFYSSFQLPR